MMQAIAQARRVLLCNAGVLRCIDKLFGKKGDGGLPSDADAPKCGKDLKSELSVRQCFNEMPEIFQSLVSGMAELPDVKAKAAFHNLLPLLILFPLHMLFSRS